MPLNSTLFSRSMIEMVEECCQKLNIIIIIYHDFSLHHGGVVMSSQIILRQSSNIHPSDHIPGTCALIFSSCVPFRVYPNHIMLRHPTPFQVIIRLIAGGRSKERMAMQEWSRYTQSSTAALGLSTSTYLSRIVDLPPSSSLCCPRPSSRHPSNQTSVYPILAFH